ncbi:Bacterial lipid A biosynthesis acyltransferase [Megamonas hypermegale ART12/1]|nr:Bacterial lipid A biosynthesis acyltransferase [Megamonas hypermegale ART12/1]
MMASLTSLVEQHIRDYPEEWFWLHDRWKYVERKKKKQITCSK